MVKERILTSSEEGIYFLNQYSGCFSIATISHLQGDINIDKLKKSIDIIQGQNLLLNCVIIKDNNNLNLKLKELETEKVTLEVIVNHQNQSWESLVIQNFNNPLPLEKYVFRCLFIPPTSEDENAYFITIIAHSIADGLSSVKLHHLIFRQYESLAQNHNNIQSQIPPDISSVYQQKFANRVEKSLGYLRAILSIIKLQIKSKSHNIKKIKPQKIAPIEDRKGHFLNYCLDEEITKKIIIKSKQENITVNSFLTAAILLAIADYIEFKNKDKMTFYCQSYVDLRKRLYPTVSDEWMEILISSLMSFYTLTPHTRMLFLAKEVDNENKKELKKRDFIYYPLLLKYIIKTSIKNTQKFTPTVGISNLGKINSKKNYGNFTLANICFVPNVSVYNYSLSLSISTFNNKMTINFAFSYPSFSYEEIDKIAQRMLKIIKNNI